MDDPLLEMAQHTKISCTEFGSAYGDSPMAFENSVRIEQPIRIDYKIRPVLPRGRNGLKHFQLKLLFEQGIEQLESHADWPVAGRLTNQSWNSLHPIEYLMFFLSQARAGQCGT